MVPRLTDIRHVPYYESIMAATTYNASQKKALTHTTLLAVVFGLWFLRDYFSMFVIAGTLAYLFHPIYARLSKKVNRGSAAALTMAISFLAVLIPLIIVGVLAGAQIANIANNVAPFFEDLDTTRLAEQTLESVNSFLQTLPISTPTITEEMVVDNLKDVVVNFGGMLASNITGTFTSFLGGFTAFIIYLFLFLSLLKNGSSLLDSFRAINPLGKDLSDLYLKRIGAMVRGTVQGQFVIAAVQGLFGAIAFALAGYGELFFIIFVVFTLMSIIPLGAGILALPLGALMILFGNIWGGVIVIAEHLLINTNVDNVLRPILVPKEARLDAALMLISVFAGISLFGFLGIIIGPTLMILIVTTIQAYLDFVRQSEPKAKSRKS